MIDRPPGPRPTRAAAIQNGSALCCRESVSLHGSPGLLGLNAAGDGIKDGQLGLLNRRDGIIDCETRLPFKPLGSVFRAPASLSRFRWAMPTFNAWISAPILASNVFQSLVAVSLTDLTSRFTFTACHSELSSGGAGARPDHPIIGGR